MIPQTSPHNGFRRTRPPKNERMRAAVHDIFSVKAERCRRSFFYFMKEFWSEVSNEVFRPNWHIEYLCNELQTVAQRVAQHLPRQHDLIINVPPGTTKTTTVNIMFPVWCWINWYWMRFISASYSAALSLESAEYSRDIVRSEKFSTLFPELSIKQDKDTKSNFRVQRFADGKMSFGGNRYSTSVGGTLTGFHGHISLVDDPLDPNRAVSDTELKSANRWIDQTLSTRKVDKAVSVTILIMQRLHKEDPSGHILAKKKANVRHICLPGEIKQYREQVQPPELADHYVDGLLDPGRMNWAVMQDLEADLGQYGYAGQIGQRPTPPAGGMFKADHFATVLSMPPAIDIVKSIRYWDKAGTPDGGAYTAGVRLCMLITGKFLVADVKRGQWSSEERERIIKETAEADTRDVIIHIEQEPGSGGKESAENTIRNLAGFVCLREPPKGDKVYRADPWSVQVNNGNAMLLQGEWNHEYKEEHRDFPYSKYKDQVDASGGAFNALMRKDGKRRAGAWGRR